MKTMSTNFLGTPHTKLGRWSVSLAAGVVGVIAVIRQQERSWLVWLTIVPSLFVLLLTLGELLFPH